MNIETEAFIMNLVTELGRAFLAATDANTQTCASYAMQVGVKGIFESEYRFYILCTVHS